MLARLRGMVASLTGPETRPAEEPKAAGAAAPPAPPPPLPAPPQPEAAAVPPDSVPLAQPVPAPEALAAPAVDAALAAAEVAPPAEPVEPPAPAGPQLCPVCTAPRSDGQTWCDSCGFMFPADAPAAPATTNGPAGPTPAALAPAAVPGRLKGRYELGTLVGERGSVQRYRGLDHGAGLDNSGPVAVTILRMEKPAVAQVVETAVPVAPAAEAAPFDGGDEILPSFEDVLPAVGPATELLPAQPDWPSLPWERNLLEIIQHPGLPALLDSFEEDGFDYVVEELPTGRPLWDAWDDPDATSEQRYGLLRQVAEALRAVHQGAAILEGLRPDLVVVTPDGRARLTDLGDLLPLPLPPNTPVRGTPYTAPEVLLGNGTADARADLYGFGALLYALTVGRELTETDFERPGVPKPFIPQFPDVHPAFGRLVSKTFTPDLAARFPTDEASRDDPTGFNELIRTLDVCGRTMDNVRLEVAAWTTTGMVRTGNEDAFALLHCVESRIDDLGESALLLLADGMGGYEAGEVAAALAIRVLRKHLVQQKPFRALAGAAAFPLEGLPDPDAPVPADTEAIKKLLKEALREANRQVYSASRSGVGKRGMGCTAEVVYLDGRRVVVGHVGDSRTYHLHEGRLVQLTRDQTLVNRLVELGTLTPEEAETHPRRNELQQAVGGQPDVEPGLYSGVLTAGDWVVVCSDGVSNHVNAEQLKQMLQTEATSADMAARRLVNFVNINGATDNATIVVVRVV
jgi:serine/threonine protein phosphatase PrpC